MYGTGSSCFTAEALLFCLLFGSVYIKSVKADAFSDYFSDYECNQPLMDRSVLTATSSLTDREPDKARLNEYFSKVRQMNKHVCTRWAFDLSAWTPTLPEMAQAVAAIQVEEKQRLMKFFFIEDFLSSLVGRLLMRKYVSYCSGLSFHELQFGRDGRGKPFWISNKNVSKLSFNVSHQGDIVILAGVTSSLGTEPSISSSDFGVGADVMKVEYSGGKPINEFFRLMRSKFSKSEWQYITRPQHESEQLKAFMRNWCLKEAYVKEIGVGISTDLQNISFDLDATSPLEISSSPLTNATLTCGNAQMHDWNFEEHMIKEQYCAALAFRGCRPPKGNFELLSFDDLIVKSATAERNDIIEYCKQALQKNSKRP